ncbi:hypothetical protein ACEN9F_09285 [Duganella sp. CT11-25]|uniref:hypothetical protein n=1 Tax=unclassified Duganella TaxID=2636909 RepID=UPI0039B0F1E7
MKRLASILMVVGALIAVIAFNLDVTAGETGIVNMNMMAQRQNLLIIGCVAFLAGIVLLVGIQRQGEPKDGLRPKPQDAMHIRPAPNSKEKIVAIRERWDALLKHLLKDTTFTEFVVRLICATASAVIGAHLIAAFWDVDIWMYSLLVILFWFAMKKGHPILTLIFGVEIVACLAIPIIYIAFYEGSWSSFGYLAPELFCCIVGVVVATKFKRKAAPSIQ